MQLRLVSSSVPISPFCCTPLLEGMARKCCWEVVGYKENFRQKILPFLVLAAKRTSLTRHVIPAKQFLPPSLTSALWVVLLPGPGSSLWARLTPSTSSVGSSAQSQVSAFAPSRSFKKLSSDTRASEFLGKLNDPMPTTFIGTT